MAGNSFLVGTFYTQGTPYEEVVMNYFLNSVMNFSGQFQFKIFAIDPVGGWTRNVAEKPRVILDMLNSISDDRNLLFVDADATIERYPSVFDFIPDEYDIAFHYLDWNTWYRNNTNRKELLTGTMWFRNNSKVRELLKEWYEQALKSNRWEQQVLEEIISRNKDLKIFELSVEYCYIKTLPSGEPPYVKVDKPFIVHHQASRKLKKIIGR